MSTHSYRNDTGAPIDVVFCISEQHHADGSHPKKDRDEITVTVTPGSRLTFDVGEDNSSSILTQMTSMTEV